MALILICLHVTLFAQNINIQVNNVTVKNVMEQIKKEYGYSFVFESGDLNTQKTISVNIHNANINQVVNIVLEGQNVTYEIRDKNIIVKRSNPVQPSHNQSKKNISGSVVDPNNEPIIGASVVEMGTNNGSITDMNGNFNLTVSENAILQISYIGYLGQNKSIGNNNNIKIILQEDTQILDEIVVVGFGVQKKVNLTGAVATINSKELNSRPVSNVSQALQGLTPGLNISTTSGSLEGRPEINIRGITTIDDDASGSPLILIDGMEGDINALNPNDIENISVLKDAAASSIYGSRAPFGVILITTKSAQAGKTQLNYSTSFRASKPILLPEMMDSYTFAMYFNEANRNDGSGDYFSSERVQRIKDFQDGKLGKNTIIPNSNNPTYWADGYDQGNDNVDWFGAIFKNSAMSQEHNMSITGGNERINFYLSGNILDQDGFLKMGHDEYNRFTGTAKLKAKLTDWADLSFSMRFTREKYTKPSSLSDNLFADLARQGWPMLPLYDPNGYLYSSPSPALGLRDGGVDSKQDDWKYYQLQLTLYPLKGWKIFVDMNYKTDDYFRHRDVQKTYNHDVNGNPYLSSNSSSVQEQASRTNYFSPNIYSEYFRAFGDHNMKVMLGFQSELNKFRDLSATRQGIIIPGSPVLDITSGTDGNGKTVSPSVSGKYTDWATTGYFGRINYDYKGRYLAEINLRYDGTSRFRSDKQWKLFPSASLGWNVSHEKFWQPLLKYINYFKVRGSYGLLGNQNTKSLYPTYQIMNYETNKSTWLVNGLQTNIASAPKLISSTMTWETIRTLNGGIDMGFFNNRLQATAEAFVRYTDDMIGPAVELPSILGTDVPKTNNTDLKTYGFELSISWQDRLKNGLGYSARFSLSDAQTIITKYPNETGKLDTHYSGKKYGEIWGYVTKGIAKTNEEMDEHLASLPNGGQNALGSKWEAGDVMYVDLNGDGKIDNGSNTTGDHGDLTVIGNSTPRFAFSLDLGADWKGFDLRAFFQGIGKKDYFQNSYYFWGVGPDWGVWRSTGLVEHKDYFRDDPNDPLGLNMNAYYPRPIFNTSKNQKTQSKYLQDASYIRLKNLQLGYTLPQSLTKKIKAQRIRIYVSGENLLTWTDMIKIFDPETIDGGWGGNAYPLSKVYSAGLSINF